MAQKNTPDANKLDKVVAEARQNREKREQSYRDLSLKMYPWICGRCQREFTRENIQELTVHHRDHNHDNNPQDGSNWELLCIYCHDNEHQRYLDHDSSGGTELAAKKADSATFNPFSDLKSLLDKKE